MSPVLLSPSRIALTTSLALLAGLAGAAEGEPVAAAAAEMAPAAPRTLSLAEAITLSASTAPVAISKLDAAISKAGLGAERSGLLPNLSATAGAQRAASWMRTDDQTVRIAPGNAFDARLRLGQAIIDLEQWHRTSSAERQLAASEAAGTVALEEAASTAGSAYVTLAAAQALVVVRTEDLKLAEDLLSQAKAQVAAGAAEAIAEVRAASRVQTAKSALTTAEGSVRRGQIVLARALDLDPGLTLITGDTLTDQLGAADLPTDTAKAERTAQAVRPELRVSRETLAALDESRRAAAGAQLPRLDGFADAGRGGARLNETENVWTVGVGLTIPLIDGSQYREEQASLRVSQERLRQRQLIDRIKAEVREALTVIATAQARLVSDLAGRSLAEEELRQARARFNAGAAGNLEVIDAQRSLSVAQEAVITADEALAQARVRLARAIGAATGLR
jgi:outer membrane protein TolC